MSERGGRYQRSIVGGIGAMIVTVAVVLGFVLLRSLGRGDVEVEPEAVDYQETVGLVQASGAKVVYPRRLPEGWIATSVDASAGTAREWGMGMLTEDGRFAGIRLEPGPIQDLLEVYVDEEAAAEGARRLPGDLADQWRVFTDDGGDTAYATELDDRVLLVYGSADEASLEALVAVLTVEPL